LYYIRFLCAVNNYVLFAMQNQDNYCTMKKLLKNKWAWAVVIVVIIGGIYYSGAWKPAELETPVATEETRG